MSDIAPKCKKHDHNVLVLNNPCIFYQALLISVGLSYHDDNGFLGVIMQ